MTTVPRRVAALYGAALIGLGLVALPVAYLVIRAAGADGDSWSDLLSVDTALLAVRSIGLAIAVAAAAVAVAVPLAFLTVRTDLPLRRFWAVTAALPLVIPSYVGALTLLGAFGPRGLLQQILAPLGVERLPELYGFWGAWATLTLFTYPYILLIVSAAWRRVDVSLERAARSLGHGRLRSFRTAVMPQLRSSIVAGALLCALYTLSDFGVVSLMRFNTFTRSIFVHYRSLFDREGAAILSLVLCLLTVAVLIVERRMLRGSPSGAQARQRAADTGALVTLGRWRWPAIGYCAAICAMALVVPMATLTWWIADQAADASMLTQLQTVASATVDSLTASLAAALACALLSLPIAILAVRRPGRLSSFIESGTYAGFALPGVVAALGLVFFATRYAGALYQTLAVLVVAYVIRFLPQAVGATRSAVERINPSLEAASRGMGHSELATFRRITLPLAASGVAAGAMLVFLTAMKELPATLILRPTGFESLATEIWQQTSVADLPEAALPALVLIAISAVPMWLLVIAPGAATQASE